MFSQRKPPETVAAVDLGSNSFHMIVARIVDGQVHVLDRLRETVRLASGLDARNNIGPDAVARALDCLQRFGQRVRNLPHGAVRAVGTNTLRRARNSDPFLYDAMLALGHPIEIIGGREEARLIYLGVAHSLADDGGTRLVVDIGGGSTELIIGERFEPQMMESLHMGCVTMSAGYFAEGVISESAWRRADIAARLELQPIALVYRLKGWQTSVGASGTIIAIERAVQQMGWSRFGISLESLHQLRQYMLRAGHVDRLQIEAVSRDRAPVFAGGVAVLLAVFEALGIAHMRVSDGALREGLVYDLLGRITHEDVRGRTIESLMRRFQVDVVHAQRVERTVTALFDALADAWKLDEDYAYALMWAVRLHEVGLAISHSQYHKHGAYLIENADLSGFSRQGQKMLALLVRTHRRKFPTRLFDELADEHRNKVLQLAMLLRVAVLLHRSRGEEPIPIREVAAIQGGLRIVFEGGWLDAHPLTRADLERERDYLKTAKMRLKFE